MARFGVGGTLTSMIRVQTTTLSFPGSGREATGNGGSGRKAMANGGSRREATVNSGSGREATGYDGVWSWGDCSTYPLGQRLVQLVVEQFVWHPQYLKVQQVFAW